MSNLKDRVAIVTGASSGIGEAIALDLAASGVRVALVARRKERLDAVLHAIEAKGGEGLAIACDASSQASAVMAVSSTVDKWGKVDILVNNAGVMYLGSVAGANTEDWRKMFDINVLGLMYFTHAVLPVMKKTGGNIVNVSSVSGRVVNARSAAYSATKFAVNGFSDGLRQEVAKDNIRVTIIEPGAVLTELTDHITDEATKANVKEWVATMTALTSEDIARAVTYAVGQPDHVNVNEIMIRPTDQTF